MVRKRGASESGADMSIKMKELPTSERPYEKLELYGADKLSNTELLAIIIKSGTREESAVQLAQKVLAMNDMTDQNSLLFLQNLSMTDLTNIKGIGKVKAIQIMAVIELAKRINKPIHTNQIKIKSTADIANLLMNELKHEKREVIKLILLNTKNIILKIKDITYGGTNFAHMEPKDIITEALKIEAPKMIVVHNHPSGDPTPSKADFGITDRIYEACNLMGIELLDHVIIGNNTYESVFLERNKNYEI